MLNNNDVKIIVRSDAFKKSGIICCNNSIKLDTVDESFIKRISTDSLLSLSSNLMISNAKDEEIINVIRREIKREYKNKYNRVSEFYISSLGLEDKVNLNKKVTLKNIVNRVDANDFQLVEIKYKIIDDNWTTISQINATLDDFVGLIFDKKIDNFIRLLRYRYCEVYYSFYAIDIDEFNFRSKDIMNALCTLLIISDLNNININSKYRTKFRL